MSEELRRICLLCLQEKVIQNSHLLPAAFYPDLSEPTAENPNPAIVSKEVAFQSSRQLTADALCAACEHLLNSRGEDWVIRHRWQRKKGFLLREKVMKAKYFITDGSLTAYHLAGLDNVNVSKLVHFATGMFWRASLNVWTVNRIKKRFISVGKYGDDFRRFLLGEADFPSKAALCLTLSGQPEPLLLAKLPHSVTRDGYHLHSFTVPGMKFDLAVGNQIPAKFGTMGLTSAQNKVIFVDDALDLLVHESVRKVTRNTRMVAGLRKHAENHRKQQSEEPNS